MPATTFDDIKIIIILGGTECYILKAHIAI